MPVKWTEARIYKLVLSYIRHECLWKHDINSYNDSEARYNAYLEIISDLNIQDLSVNEVRDKIKQIRRTYRTELAKIRDANLRGCPYKPKITWFELFHEFLYANITEENPKNDTSLEAELSNSKIDEYNCRLSQSLYSPLRNYLVNERPRCLQYSPIPPNLDTSPTKLTKHAVPLQIKTIPSSRCNISSSFQRVDAALQSFVTQEPHIVAQPMSNDQVLSTAGDCSSIALPNAENQSLATTDTMRKNEHHRRSGDEFDVFGKSVACQLRELSLSQALRTQTKIQSLLAEERINSSNTQGNKSEMKRIPHRHKHRHNDSRATQSSRSSRSSFNSNSNFRYQSASDLSSSREPSHNRQSKHTEMREISQKMKH